MHFAPRGFLVNPSLLKNQHFQIQSRVFTHVAIICTNLIEQKRAFT